MLVVGLSSSIDVSACDVLDASHKTTDDALKDSLAFSAPYLAV